MWNIPTKVIKKLILLAPVSLLALAACLPVPAHRYTEPVDRVAKDHHAVVLLVQGLYPEETSFCLVYFPPLGSRVPHEDLRQAEGIP